MTRTMIGKVAVLSKRVVPFGADLVPRGWEQVLLDRVDAPPLDFAGCQISRHWTRLYDDSVIGITLWQRPRSGFAVAFTVCTDGVLSSDAVAVDSLAEAVTFLEDYCALPPPPPHIAGPLCDALMRMQKTAHFAQAFAFLVGEALAAWTALTNDPSDTFHQGRANA